MRKFWTNNRIQQLVEMKNEPEQNQRFLDAAGKAQQTKKCWDNLSKAISHTPKGVEAKEKYKYLIKMYRQYDADAKTNCNGQVSWRHYYFLKKFFISDPSITPITLVDIGIINTTQNRDSEYGTANESIISINKSSKNKNTKEEMGKRFLNESKNSNS